jgi:hypothetical protein
MRESKEKGTSVGTEIDDREFRSESGRKSGYCTVRLVERILRVRALTERRALYRHNHCLPYLFRNERLG